jgi:dolichyl-phosphate mannosyltransferase polypeptide 2 regulatory subunit
MVEAKTRGTIYMLIIAGGWLYYSFWILIIPHIDEDQWLQNYFPDLWWAISIPIMIGLIFLSFAFTFAGLAFYFESKQKVVTLEDEDEDKQA